MPIDTDRHPPNISVYHINKQDVGEDKSDADNTISHLLFEFSISRGKSPVVRAKHVRGNRFRIYFPLGFVQFLAMPHNTKDFQEVKPYIEGKFVGDWDIFNQKTSWYLITPDDDGGYLFEAVN